MADITVTITNATAEEQRGMAWALSQYKEEHPADKVKDAGELLARIAATDYLPQWINSEAGQTMAKVALLWRKADTESRRKALLVLEEGITVK